jgi:hypothetical protein
MDEQDFERLLKGGPLQVPPDFEAAVMARIARLPLPEFAAPPSWAERLQPWLQWLALAGGALIGAVQLAAFMLGIWTAVAAT